MLNGFEFGLALSDPTERDLATRIYYRLSKIEQEMQGAKLTKEIANCNDAEFEEQYVLTGIVYYPHAKHIDNLVIVIIDDFSKITKAIDQIDNADVKLVLREWYCMLKEVLCTYDVAQAYYLNRKG
jgi:hypothetical protein